jgi:hypothetical protein
LGSLLRIELLLLFLDAAPPPLADAGSANAPEPDKSGPPDSTEVASLPSSMKLLWLSAEQQWQLKPQTKCSERGVELSGQQSAIKVICEKS